MTNQLLAAWVGIVEGGWLGALVLVALSVLLSALVVGLVGAYRAVMNTIEDAARDERRTLDRIMRASSPGAAGPSSARRKVS